MAKKTKRQARKMAIPATSIGSASISSNGSRTFEREFNPDYTPVVKDLRRIAMLAGSFFVVLVILSFFLR